MSGRETRFSIPSGCIAVGLSIALVARVLLIDNAEAILVVAPALIGGPVHPAVFADGHTHRGLRRWVPHMAEREQQQEMTGLKPFPDTADLYDRALGAVEMWVK